MKTNLLTAEDILSCAGHLVIVDTETTGLYWWENELIGIGIHCPDTGVSGYAHTCTFEQKPLGNPKTKKEWLGQMDFSKSKRGKRLLETVTYQPTVLGAVPSEVRIRHYTAAVQSIANHPDTVLVGHNLKFDLHFLRLRSWELPCKIVDTSVMVHLLDSRMKKSLALCEREFLGTDSKRHHVSLADKRFSKKPWLWEPHVLEDYCVNDCVVTHQLMETLVPYVKEKGLSKLFSLQMRYLRLLQKMEWRGVQVATIFCHEAIAEFEKNILGLEKDLFDTVGYQFNWRSNDQLSEAIYAKLGIAIPVNPYAEDRWFDAAHHRAAKIYTKSATNSSLLVRENHPLKGLLLDLRESVKLLEYAHKYLTLRDNQGVLHASFNQTKTLTGRLSSSEPNLQNLPSSKRKVDIESVYTGGATRVGGYNLRQALVARSGYRLVSIDHKQQEMRLLAILSQEPVMLEAMRNREDIHLRVAIQVWGDCGKETNKIHREWSKAISFGLIYGLSEESLQEYFTKVGVEAVASEVKEQYFDAFPRLRPWFQEVIQEVKDTGFVRYWSGRYWYADNDGEGYKGVNAKIQGGCADFISVVVLRADKVLEKQGWGNLLIIVHDEAVFEIKEEFLDIATVVLARAMEGEDVFGIPFATDVEVGDSYGGLEEYPLARETSTVEWKEYA